MEETTSQMSWQTEAPKQNTTSNPFTVDIPKPKLNTTIKSAFSKGNNTELPISNCRIQNYNEEIGMFRFKVRYVIKFEWNGLEQQIIRRFSHFRAFRLALNKQLLYSINYPTHRKRLVK